MNSRKEALDRRTSAVILSEVVAMVAALSLAVLIGVILGAGP